jgi:hypothetical protein
MIDGIVSRHRGILGSVLLLVMLSGGLALYLMLVGPLPKATAQAHLAGLDCWVR